MISIDSVRYVVGGCPPVMPCHILEKVDLPVGLTNEGGLWVLHGQHGKTYCVRLLEHGITLGDVV